MVKRSNKWKVVSCEQCGKNFPQYGDYITKLCSTDCKYIYRNVRNFFVKLYRYIPKGKKLPKPYMRKPWPRTTSLIIPCATCGKEVINLNGTYKYCKKCSIKSRLKTKYDYKRRQKLNKPIKIPKQYIVFTLPFKIQHCETCGKEFVIHGFRGPRRFCENNECKRIAVNNARRKRYMVRRKEPKFHIQKVITSAIAKSVRDKKYRCWEELVGYTLEDLMKRLENQFQEGMVWSNYGKWHIDHIKPISKWNFISCNDMEFKQCWSLSNLQPLWAIDNIRKSNRWA